MDEGRIKTLPSGVKFIGRYIDEPSNPKSLTLEEVDLLNRYDIPIVSISEIGYPTSDEYFKAEKSKWTEMFSLQIKRMRRLGQPERSALYAAIDYDCVSLEILRDFIETFIFEMNHAGYSAGFYGSAHVLDFCKCVNPHVKTWLSGSTGWTGYSEKYECDIRQIVLQGDYDKDIARSVTTIGAWLPRAAKPKYGIDGVTKPMI